MLLSKRPEVVVAFFACARLGAIHVPVNFKLHPDQIADQFRTAGVRTVVLEPEFEPLLRHLLPLLPDPRRIVYVDGPGRHGDGVWEAELGPWAGGHSPRADDPDRKSVV